ncbi:myo-inositol 2-dehydrogenase/D-chiro-inositol 1-dehydrogenase [Catalinimonas alkaloidigena]|uniref:Gfo/Idh/MocA family protein n=1 Tax=Catalinimonas alkaloidigena TaxID=1075417 RepID=UPI002406905B|nr:Gfo/Idh/MocA family oxidoreductase [Catalinimonas alkaloidigena]MDF9797266.1 myo-inositol 2-dehydrogenase/D-chiro-inositol 1-dehydrogenase [Catalinimonas alkaloidigena]
MKNLEFNKSINRRKFVKSSAAAAAGGVFLSQLPSAASAYVGGNETLRVAVIGCGGRGTGAAVQALSVKEDVKLVAMADAFKDRLDESYDNIMKKHGKSGRVDVPEENKFVGFDGYKNAIALADVVLLATPPGFRPIHFEEAVNQGKHVFMEKPVATDAPGVRKVLEVAQKAKQNKLNVVVGLQRHYQPSYLELMKRIHNGEIGDIVGGQVYWNSSGVWVRERQPQQTEMEYQMRNWYYFTWLCGDHIMEQHIHNIDVANWAKQSYPVMAQGMGGREVRTGPDHGEIFDHHFVEFHYEDGTMINSQCRHIEGCMNKVSESFVGTKGRATTDGTTMITDTKGNTLWKHRDKNDPNPYQVEHDRLFSAIVNGNELLADAENGAKSTMTSLLGRMATYSGKVVTWDEALNSNMSLMPQKFSFDATPPVVPGADGKYPVPVPGKTKVI